MNWVQAARWGIAGGLAAGVLTLMTAVTTAGFRWPWKRGELGPRLFVVGCGLLLGALVAAAASSQMSGDWPAFAMGAAAPATIRGLLSGIEVQSVPRHSLPLSPPPADTEERKPAVKDGINEIVG
jgi:hypothetical protein